MPRWLRAARALVLYVIAVVWLTWPLAGNLTTHLPYTAGPSFTDIPQVTWALAWQTHALATSPAHYLDGNIYHPDRHALLYTDMALFSLPIFAPIFLATANPTLAIDVVLLAGIVLTAWSIHLVIERWSGSWLAGVVGASVLLGNPWAIPWFFGWAPTYAMLWLLPCIAYRAARPLRRVRDGVVLAALVALQSTANVVYVAPAALAPVGLLAAVRLTRPGTVRAGVRLAGALVLAGLLLMPIYVGYGTIRGQNPTLARQSVWARPARNQDEAPVPTVRFPRVLPDALLRRQDATWLAPSTLALVVLGTIVALARGAGSRGLATMWRQGLLWSATGMLLSTSSVRWGTYRSGLLPHYRLLERALPFVDMVMRDERRLGFPCIVGFALLAGAAFATCIRRVPERYARPAGVALAVAVVLGAAVSHRAAARPIGIFRPDDGSSRITAMLRESEGVVLELPLGSDGRDPRFHAPAMYRAIFHWRPILNGYTSYWPPGFPRRMELAARLPDGAALAPLVDETGLSAVVVNLRRCSQNERAWWILRAIHGGVGRLHYAGTDANELLFLVDRQGAALPAPTP